MLHLSMNRWRNRVPADCPGCGCRQRGQGLCPVCLAQLRPSDAQPRCPRCAHPLTSRGCPDCGVQLPAYDRVVAAFDHTGLGRELIHAYKLRRQLSLAPLLADWLAQAVLDVLEPEAHPDWIVPVPARRAALRQRGFSPPAEIARLLARRVRVPSCLEIVQRQHEGTRQAGLARVQRLQAQAGVFVCEVPAQVQGRRIAVVDDVLTTGATLQSMAAVLKDAGAFRVEGWVLARAVGHRPS